MYKLIIVEDDYQIRTGLSTFFPWTEVGFEYTRDFKNGIDALKFLEEGNLVHVVLTDIIMPDMDGIELASYLQKHYPNILVVFLSAYKSFEYAQQAIRLNVKNYIVKGTRYDELIKAFREIREMLERRVSFSCRYQQDMLPVMPDTIECIIALIDQDPGSATLSSIGEQIGMSTSYLSKYFKEKTGRNFQDYLMEKKMEVARDSLVLQNMDIVSVSVKLGYANEKNFSRAFKSYHGVSPSTYKKQTLSLIKVF
jgi:two-component system response regulator YesN